MKNYTITVNGNVYDVTVEEKGAGSAPAAPVAAAPVAAAAPAPKAAAPSGAGAIVVTAQSTGKIFSIDASVGQSVKRGDTILTLEAMKMELPVVAPQDGVIASIEVSKGDEVASGATLATMN